LFSFHRDFQNIKVYNYYGFFRAIEISRITSGYIKKNTPRFLGGLKGCLHLVVGGGKMKARKLFIPYGLA